MILLRTDRPLALLGRAAQNLWNRVTRGRRPVTGLDIRLLAERDTIRAVLGRHWRQAAVLTAGRLGFDYGCLLAALRATGADPRPSCMVHVPQKTDLTQPMLPWGGTFAPKPRAEGHQSVPEAARARRTLRPAESQDESPVF